VTPPQVVTSQQVALPHLATCAQQLDTIGIVTEATGLGIETVGVGAEIAAQAIPPPGNQVAEAIAIGTQVGGLVVQGVALGNQIIATGLPSCEEDFTGTVRVLAGGVNVSGVSIFKNDVGIDANLNVSGSVNANQVHAAQGISAHGGAIWIGDPGGLTYFSGITIGGGALSGAGTGGPLAFTGDVTAIAIGNGASAFNVNNTALGTGALAGGAGGINATAIGANSSAGFANSAAFGAGAVTTRANQQTFGTPANTYTMPGITSGASRAVQSGPLQLPTTDAAGNLASDGGATFKAIARTQAGVAVAMAMTPPVLTAGDSFGIKVGMGAFNSYGAPSTAFGISAIGVVARNLFTNRDRLALEAGAGFGYSEFMGYNENHVAGGRVGLQLTW
jgi:hypothetical protein